MGMIEKFEIGGHKRSYETEHLYYEHSLQGKMSNTPIQQNFPVLNWVNDQEVNRSYRWKNVLFICYFYVLSAVTWLLERATMSLRGNCRRIREGYGLPIVTITIKERGSWKTTVPCKFPTALGHVLTVVSS